MKLKLRLLFVDQSRDIGCTQLRQFIASSTQGCIYLKQKDGARLSVYSLEKALLAHCLLLNELKGGSRQSKLSVCFPLVLTCLLNKPLSQNVIRLSAIRQCPKYVLFKSPAPTDIKTRIFDGNCSKNSSCSVVMLRAPIQIHFRKMFNITEQLLLCTI